MPPAEVETNYCESLKTADEESFAGQLTLHQTRRDPVTESDVSLGYVDEGLGSRLDEILADEEAEQNLRRYFGDVPGDWFTGSRFERFAGGGDREDVRDVVTAHDVVALSLLSVEVPGSLALKLLEDR